MPLPLPLDDVNKINEIVSREKLDICVVSYGGSGSNTLANMLEKNGYKCRSPIWHDGLCHCPVPVHLNIPVIYIYRNILHAYASVKRRGTGFWDVNQSKLSNGTLPANEFSDEKLFTLMLEQFAKWREALPNELLLFLNYEDCFDPRVLEVLRTFLHNPNLLHFPVNFVEPNTTSYHIQHDLCLAELVEKHTHLIEQTKERRIRNDR